MSHGNIKIDTETVLPYFDTIRDLDGDGKLSDGDQLDIKIPNAAFVDRDGDDKFSDGDKSLGDGTQTYSVSPLEERNPRAMEDILSVASGRTVRILDEAGRGNEDYYLAVSSENNPLELERLVHIGYVDHGKGTIRNSVDTPDADVEIPDLATMTLTLATSANAFDGAYDVKDRLEARLQKGLRVYHADFTHLALNWATGEVGGDLRRLEAGVSRCNRRVGRLEDIMLREAYVPLR